MTPESAISVDMLHRYLNELEIRLVCFDLGINYSSLPASSKATQIQALVKFCEDQAILGQLQSVVRSRRPDIRFNEPTSSQSNRVRVEFVIPADILKLTTTKRSKVLVQIIASCLHIQEDCIHVLLESSETGNTSRLILGMARPVAERLVTSFVGCRGQAYHILKTGLNVKSVRIIDRVPDQSQTLVARSTARVHGAMRLALYLSIPACLFLAAGILTLWRYPDGGPHALFTALLAASPGVMAWGAIPFIAAKFMERIHHMDGWERSLKYLSLSIFGPLFRNNPYIFIQEGGTRIPGSQVKLLPQGRPMSPGPGGPCTLIIFNDSAVVLERSGHYTAIMLPGVYSIGRFERIHQIVDLRPQSHKCDARVMTRDGIPLNVKVTATYQIRWLGEPTVDKPYPVDADAVLKAAESLAVFQTKDGQFRLRTWSDRIGSMLDSELRSLIARYRLDELFEPRNDELEPCAQLQYAYAEALEKMANRFGADITDVRMGTFEFESEGITKRFMETWKAEWVNRARISQSFVDADVIRVREQARAFAQFEMVQEITREFQPLAGNSSIPISLLTLRFIEVIQRMASDPEGGIFLPREALATLDGVRKMLEETQAPENIAGSSDANQGGEGK